MTLSSKLILLAIACMYFSLVRNKLKTLHIGCLHLFVQFSKVYFVVQQQLLYYTQVSTVCQELF